MKQTILRCFAVLAALFAVSVYAADNNYKTTMQPIPEVLKTRLLKGIGPSTDIIVINYTKNNIFIGFPSYQWIAGETSARIVQENRTDNTQIQLGLNNQGPWFFDQNIFRRARISITPGNNGQYVVNVKND